MHHHWRQQRLRNYHKGSAVNNYIDGVVDTSDDATMDGISVTHVADKHIDNHDHNENTDDDHDNNNDIDGVIYRLSVNDLSMIYR